MIKKILMIILSIIMFSAIFTGCAPKKEKVVIYTSIETYRLVYLNKRLHEEFPQYDITVEYMPTGNQVAKLLAEGSESECDITDTLEFTYLQELERNGVLEKLPMYDKSIYCDDLVISDNFIPEVRSSGSIVVNTKVLAERNLPEPKSYEDLLNPIYKCQISMSNPKSSGTGCMFLKALVNAWGEEKAFDYFDKLAPNILQFTSSGYGPLNAVLQEEAAIALGITAPAVRQINEGQPLKLLQFEEGAPFSLLGQGVIKGKLERKAVREVFDFLVNQFNYEHNEIFFPEKIFKDKDFTLKNYPVIDRYADMSNYTDIEKDKLLDKWKY